jgi:hypothetical protein
VPAPSSKTAIILTALQVETRAILRHLPDCSEEVVEGTVFHHGRFGGWDVAVAELGGTTELVKSLNRTLRSIADWTSSKSSFL